MFDLCFGILAFWIFGYGIAFGENEYVNYIFGTNKNYFVSSGFKKEIVHPTKDIYMEFIFYL